MTPAQGQTIHKDDVFKKVKAEPEIVWER